LVKFAPLIFNSVYEGSMSQK